ncbi:MAG: hypothetical protein V4547_16300 [Bacteroidota bacterium]
MKIKLSFLLLFICLALTAQNNPARWVHGVLTNKVIPIPFTTAQIAALPTQTTGTMVFNSTLNIWQFYNGTSWVAFGGGGGPETSDLNDVTLRGAFTEQDIEFQAGANPKWWTGVFMGTLEGEVLTANRARLLPDANAVLVADVNGYYGNSAGHVAIPFKTVEGNNIVGSGDVSVFPSQTGNSGKILTTNGTSTSWTTPPSLVGYIPYIGANTAVNLNTQTLAAGETTISGNFHQQKGIQDNAHTHNKVDVNDYYILLSNTNGTDRDAFGTAEASLEPETGSVLSHRSLDSNLVSFVSAFRNEIQNNAYVNQAGYLPKITNSVGNDFTGNFSEVKQTENAFTYNGHQILTTNDSDNLDLQEITNHGAETTNPITVQDTSDGVYLGENPSNAEASGIYSKGTNLPVAQFDNSTGDWEFANYFIHVQNGGGYVGLNTSSPEQRLDVAGNLRVQGTIYDYYNVQGTKGQVLESDGSGIMSWQTPHQLGSVKVTDLESQAFADLGSAHSWLVSYYAGDPVDITNESFYNHVYYFDIPAGSPMDNNTEFCGASTGHVKFEDPYGLATSFDNNAFQDNNQNNTLGDIHALDYFFENSSGNNIIKSITSVGNYSFKESVGNNKIGNILSIGDECFKGSSGDNIIGNVSIAGNDFFSSSTGNNTMETINVGNYAFGDAVPTKKNTIYKLQSIADDFAFNYTGRFDVGLWGDDGSDNLNSTLFTSGNLVWVHTFYSNKFNSLILGTDSDISNVEANLTNINRIIIFE